MEKVIMIHHIEYPILNEQIEEPSRANPKRPARPPQLLHQKATKLKTLQDCLSTVKN